MLELFPKQDSHAREIYRALLSNRSALDTSETGTGKTIVAAHIARHWVSKGKPFGVVCPKSVITNWERVLADHGVTPLFVLNYEKLKNGRDGIVRIKRKMKRGKLFEWEVPADTLLVFDEVQACKGEYTQNAQLLIAARNRRLHTLSLSATAAKDPTELRALGYSLNLHELNEKTNNNSFWHFMRRNGCSQDPWRQWKMRKNADLSDLNHTIFEERRVAHGLRTSDLPDAFKNNHVQVEVGDYKGAAKAYEECGVTRDAVDQLLFGIAAKKAKSTATITDILRARQYVEALKIPHLIDETNDLLLQGKAVVVFLNFRESIALFRESFPESGIIIGQQKDRQENIDAFAQDKTRVIVVSAQAGGSGIDLHDMRGEFPRVALISPTFSVQVYKQVLGRCYRAGMKSDSIQKVLLAAGSIEEYVQEKCARGIETMEQMLS